MPIFAFQLDVKRLELLDEVLPTAKRIGILAETDRKLTSDALDRAARDLGVEIVLLAARSNEEIADAIDAMKVKSVDAVNVLASAKLWSIHPLILNRLNSHGIPSIWQWPQGAEGVDRVWPSFGWSTSSMWSASCEALAGRQSDGHTRGTAE